MPSLSGRVPSPAALASCASPEALNMRDARPPAPLPTRTHPTPGSGKSGLRARSEAPRRPLSRAAMAEAAPRPGISDWVLRLPPPRAASFLPLPGAARGSARGAALMRLRLDAAPPARGSAAQRSTRLRWRGGGSPGDPARDQTGGRRT